MDARLVPLALGTWLGCAGAILIVSAIEPFAAVLWLLLAVGAVVSARGQRSRTQLLALGCAVGAVVGSARALPLASGPLRTAAHDHATVSAEVIINSVPTTYIRRTALDWSSTSTSLVRATVTQATFRGGTISCNLPVMVSSRQSLDWTVPGTHLRVDGVMEPANPSRGAVVFLRARQVHELKGPPTYQWWASKLRHSLVRAMVGKPRDAAQLVPGLAVGDTSAISASLTAAMRASGLAHLTAVSGSNVALLTVLVLSATRRLHRRQRTAVVAIALAGFTVLVQPQPSVVRAVAMGAVAGYAVIHRRKSHAIAVLAAAITALLLLDPWLALSIGFALSVAATTALIVIAPTLRANQWHSRFRRTVVHTLIATCAAQVAVLPLMLAMGATVSLASIPANLIAVPLAGPVMVSGLAVALVASVAPGVASLLAWIPAVCAMPIASIARTSAQWQALVLHLPHSHWAIASTAGIAIAAAVVVLQWPRWSDAQRGTALTCVLVLIGALLLPPQVRHSAFPVRDWRFAFCDVGQGDATVVRTAANSAIVVDAGPDSESVNTCLSQLHIRYIPLLVLTHFHADHVGGIEGVLRKRRVGTVAVTALEDPVAMAQWVGVVLSKNHLSPMVLNYPARLTVQDVGVHVEWPRRLILGQGSDANNASIVLRIQVAGVSLLLTGDIEPPVQDRLAPSIGHASVMKMPHHGSAHQSTAFAHAVRPNVVVTSVGLNNDYGHPAASALELYQFLGAQVWRTDLDGAVAIAIRDGHPVAVSARGHT